MLKLASNHFRTMYCALYVLFAGGISPSTMHAHLPAGKLHGAVMPDALQWQERLLVQQNKLSALLERCTFELKTKRIVLTDGNSVQVIAALQNLLRDAQAQDRKYTLLQVHVTAHDTVVRTLRMLLAKKVVKIPLHENAHLFKHYVKISTDMRLVTELYDATDALIARTITDLDNWGLSKFNILACKVQDELEERNINTIIKCSLPYVGIALLFVYLNDKNAFESSSVPGLPGLKRMVGTLPGRDKLIGKDKWIGLESFQRILNPAVFLVPVATGDAKRAYEWVSDMIKKGMAYAQGESYNPPSPIRESKVKFADIYGNSIAKEFLTDMAHYLLLEKRIQRSGHPLVKSCLFAGNLAIGKDLGYALASKTTQVFADAGRRKKCGVYDIHASSLIEKSLDAVVKEAEKQGPCVIVINELDWLFTVKNIEPKVIADLINTLTKTVSPTSKKQIVVIATVRSIEKIPSVLLSSSCFGTRLAIIEKIPSVLLSSSCFGTRLAIEELSDVQRRQIIVDYAAKCGGSVSDELLATMVQKTVGCSKNDLVLMLNQAFTAAQINREPLNTVHIQRVLDLRA